MVALSACPGRREVVVWASYWRRGRSGNAIGLTKFARQSAVRAQHGPCCSHTEERFFSDIWRPCGDLVDSLGRHGRSVVAVLCDGGLKLLYFLSQFSLKHGGYFVSDTITRHKLYIVVHTKWLPFYRQILNAFSCMAIVVSFWKFHLNLKIY